MDATAKDEGDDSEAEKVIDSDNDGLSDMTEKELGTNPNMKVRLEVPDM